MYEALLSYFSRSFFHVPFFIVESEEHEYSDDSEGDEDSSPGGGFVLQIHSDNVSEERQDDDHKVHHVQNMVTREEYTNSL